ncbi:MAG: hypothetical protein ACREEM_15865 [Blastocatellia bacterium]
MPFSQFQTVGQVIRKYPLQIEQKNFLPEITTGLPDWLIENIRFALEQRSREDNESFLAETLIVPLLLQAWKGHNKLKLWSHRTISYNDELLGEPDYLIAAKPVGVTDRFLVTPMLAIVEAKKEDFDRGWGQCLIGMLTCQKINADDNLPIYGIVSTGLAWEFGKLEGKTLTQHPTPYAINDPEKIYGLLNFIFAECEKNLLLTRSQEPKAA